MSFIKNLIGINNFNTSKVFNIEEIFNEYDKERKKVKELTNTSKEIINFYYLDNELLINKNLVVISF